MPCPATTASRCAPFTASRSPIRCRRTTATALIASSATTPAAANRATASVTGDTRLESRSDIQNQRVTAFRALIPLRAAALQLTPDLAVRVLLGVHVHV